MSRLLLEILKAKRGEFAATGASRPEAPCVPGELWPSFRQRELGIGPITAPSTTFVLISMYGVAGSEALLRVCGNGCSRPTLGGVYATATNRLFVEEPISEGKAKCLLG